MAGPIKCRECKHPVANKGSVVLPAGIYGGRTLCVPCVDALMVKHDVYSVSSLITVYLRAHQDAGHVAALIRRVEELERLLDQVTRP